MSTETLQFRTEPKQLLHLIVHSLSSHKDRFQRELTSNASDALRFQPLTKPGTGRNGSDSLALVSSRGNETTAGVRRGEPILGGAECRAASGTYEGGTREVSRWSARRAASVSRAPGAPAASSRKP
jgi:hypothetical protein